jgi:hypothetical protein
MPTFVGEYTLNKFGVKKLADTKLQTMINSILSAYKTDPRVRLFGRMCGVVDTEYYSPLISDIFLEVCRVVS